MTDDLERRLRTSLSGSALPSAPDSLREALDHLPDDAGPIGAAGQRWRLAWVTPALVIVVVIALIAAWLPGGILGPAGPTASPRGSQSALPSTGPDVTWVHAAAMPHALIDSVIAVPSGGFLAAGSVFDVQGQLWSSSDGTSWRQLGQSDPSLQGSLFTQIVALPHGGFLLIGEAVALDGQCGGGAAGCNPVNQLRMWTSNDGRTWQAVPATGMAAFGRAESVQVVVGPDGLVAWGLIAPITGPMTSATWFSRDGTTWTQGQQFRQAFPTASPDWVAAIPGGFIATGLRDVNSASPDTDGGAWFSRDGLTWSAAALPSGAPHLGGLSVAARGTIAIPVGAVIPTAVYRTTDGSAWQMQSAPFALGQNLTRFVSDGSRIIALSAVHAWMSTDASTWQELGQTIPPPLDGFVTGALSATGIVVVIGSDIWFGSWVEPSSPSTASPPPAASATPSASTHATQTKLTLTLDSSHFLVLTVSDESGGLKSARAATKAELADRPIPVDSTAYNPGGKPSSEVRLIWGGTICDTTATLVIGPDPHAWTLEDGPAPPCDASNAPRGIVLTFDQPVDATTIVVTHESAVPSPSG